MSNNNAARRASGGQSTGRTAEPARLATLDCQYPDLDAAADAIAHVVALSEHRCTPADAGRPIWVADNGLLVVASPTDTRIGFGVRRSLSLSSPLMAAIAQVNQSDPLGHLWLTEGTNESEWAVIWGATLPHRWTHTLDLQRAVFSCLTDQRDYLRTLVSHFAAFGGVAYARSASARGDSALPGQTLLEDLT